MLRRLGLYLARRLHVWHQGEVNEQRIALPELDAHLPDGFEKGLRFDVSDGASNLHQSDLGIACAAPNAGLDLVGDVGNDLNGPPQILAASLLANDVFVDLAGGVVVVPAHRGAHEALVVTEIEIGLRPIRGHEHLPVLEGIHGARIDVDVRIQLDERHLYAARFQDRGKGGGGNALAKEDTTPPVMKMKRPINPPFGDRNRPVSERPCTLSEYGPPLN